MKIALMGGWNTDSGASVHTELIGRNFVKLGHDLKVFTFFDYAFHGSQITGEDEDYVIRCFTVSSYPEQKLNAVPFLVNDYEIFVTEDLGMLPKDLLAKIFLHIKRKAKTVTVIHDGKLTDDPSFYQFDWDAIVSFDHRYRDFLIKGYPPEKVHIISYPALPWNPGDKKEAREKLGIPMDKKVIYSFGPGALRALKIIDPLKELCEKYPVMFLITAGEDDILNAYKEKLKDWKCELKLIKEAPPIEKLYEYLYASDLLLYHRESKPHVVLASTIFQCLGSGCPIVASESNFTELHGEEILKFSNSEELKQAVIDVFEQTDRYKKTIEKAKEFATKNSAEEVAKKFIKLFENLLKQ